MTISNTIRPIAATVYDTPFWKKLITFMDTKFNFCTASKYFSCDTKRLKSIQHIFIYNTNYFLSTFISFLRNTKHIYSAWNINYSKSFRCDITFFVAITYFFVSQTWDISEIYFLLTQPMTISRETRETTTSVHTPLVTRRGTTSKNKKLKIEKKIFWF